MDNNTKIYGIINKEWESTCKIIFGKNIGEMETYKNWLLKEVTPKYIKKSFRSSKDISMINQFYEDSAKYQSFEEVDYNMKFEPLNINEIKDIDTIVEAIKERVCYTGNIVLGKSSNTDKSTAITDSHNVYNSLWVDESKNVGYSSYIKMAENIFGSDKIGETKYCIKAHGTYKDTRCLEVWECSHTSDAYYCAGLENCKNAIFSFNVHNKNYVIGNLKLSQSEYNKIKASIVSQLTNELEQKKQIPTLIELLKMTLKYRKTVPKIEIQQTEEDWDERPVLTAFRNTSKLILGKDIGNMYDYKKYLVKRNFWSMEPIRSIISNKKIFKQHSTGFENIPNEFLITYPESLTLGEKLKMDKKDLENMDTITKNLWKIGYVIAEWFPGENKNIKEVPTSAFSQNCFHCTFMGYCKNCAYSTWPRNSESLFGISLTFSSMFCIRTYSSKKLTRCMEVDSSENCTDAYYLHNCENVHDSMFCFNSKNLRNAIGNAELPTSDYKKIKANILAQIANELETKKDLKWDVYNIGCAKV